MSSDENDLEFSGGQTVSDVELISTKYKRVDLIA